MTTFEQMKALVLKHQKNCRLDMFHSVYPALDGTITTDFAASIWVNGSLAQFRAATIEELDAQLGDNALAVAVSQVSVRRISELREEIARLEEVSK